jgi:Ca2+-transporting ATPase
VTAWHARSPAAAASELATDERAGLTAEEALRRLTADGPNEIERDEGRSALAILAGQFASLVIWVLIAAALLSLALGEAIDGAAILAIIVLNALIGFAQEYRSERAVAALGRLSAPSARVVRGGAAAVVPARELVRGDVLLLDAGDLVAADARLVAAAALRTNEAALTGESEPVVKELAALPETTPLAERRNSVFLGTSVAAGSGRALVTATGARTELGGIAKLLETATRDATPLQRRLDRVARLLVLASFAIVALVFALGLWRGFEPFQLFVTAVSLAVAAIPEGLPAVVTLALALGVERMVRRNALVRRLAAVETLGSTGVICTDKTGTLTVGTMTVRRLFAAGHDSESLLWVAAACNEAELAASAGEPEIVGDPTEGALLVEAEKLGIRRADVERDSPRVAVLPFDSERKMMTIVRSRDGGLVAAVKGAPEVLLARCTRIRTASGSESLDEAGRAAIRARTELFARDALRVLAFAERRFEGALPEADVERELVFVGLAGLQDPPRAEARDAVERCRRAGIRTVMITGDHPDTARAIAAEVGILGAGDQVLVGTELAGLGDAELAARVQRISVYARVTAADKLRIVRAWKALGAVVAMTGDGVNDAPALREASIGVAMGRTGTEVAKAAADIVITDDRFSSIVAAVEEGRGIFDNIRKTLGYLLAGNAAELAVMLLATLVGTPLPLLPVQLLWVNLVTDGLPALALAADPIQADVLARPPRRADAPFADRRLLGAIALTALLTSAVTFGTFAFELRTAGDVAAARNAAFSVLTFAELLRAFGARSETRGLWALGLFSNLRLFVIVAVSFALQLAIHRYGLLEELFKTQPIRLAQLATWVGLGAVPFAALEALKLFRGSQSDGKSRISGGTR